MDFGRDISKLRKAKLFMGTQFGRLAMILIGLQFLSSAALTYRFIKPGSRPGFG